MSDTPGPINGLIQGARSRLRRFFGGIVHDFRRFCRDPELRSGIIWWSLISITFFLVSTICYAIKYGKAALLFEDVPFWCLFATAAAGMLIGMFLWHSYKWEHYERNPGDKIWKLFVSKHTRRNSFAAFAITTLLIVLCLSVFIYATNKPVSNDRTLKAIRFVIENPGGIFALITGGGTLIGTYFAVHSILEIRHTISSFHQLVDRLTNLINESEGSKEGVLFFAYTLLPGAWNVDSGATEKLRTALKNPLTKIKVICLSEVDHERWLNRFESKKTLEKGEIDEVRVKSFCKDVEQLLRVVSGEQHETKVSGILKNTWNKGEGFEAAPNRLSWTQMPGYYFFSSSERAIVAVPIGMPRLGNPSAGKQGVIDVETLGFETTDRRVIQMLRREFARYANSDNAEILNQASDSDWSI